MPIALHRFLLPTLLLSASCGLPPESLSAESGEPPGHLESALCSGASVSDLSLLGASAYGGELGAAGSWTVSSANGVRLEFLVDGQTQAVSERPSASGTWNHSSQGLACGAHTLQVRAWPMVIDSAGNRTTCMAQGPRILSQSFNQDCPSASVRCLHTSRWQVTCTGSAGGGTGTLTPVWQQQYRLPSQWDWNVNLPWYEGNWTHVMSCEAPLYASLDDAQVQVQFKVRDSTGMESVVTSDLLYCLTNSIDLLY